MVGELVSFVVVGSESGSGDYCLGLSTGRSSSLADTSGLGFQRDDKSTWKMANLPSFDKGGLYHRHAVAHEQFAWDIRTEPGVVDVFAKVWGTSELTCSYDSVNMSFPLKELDLSHTKPWPHVDQSPLKKYKNCVQGIVNLLPSGPNDGGLMVLDGSTALFDEYFSTHSPPEGTEYPTGDWWAHQEDAVNWFIERGCKWHKVEAGPGDVILWDSRTVHYGAHASGQQPRFATYVCYKPIRGIRPEMAALKKEAFENCWPTSHDPLEFRVTSSKHRQEKNPNWRVEEGERTKPRTQPVLDERMLKLAGVVAY